jgi:hypothetical protein
MTMRTASPGEIDAIRAHLSAGNEIAIVTHGPALALDKRHVEYIRADGDGYRLGWPGKRSVFTDADSVRFVPAGQTIRSRRRRS